MFNIIYDALLRGIYGIRKYIIFYIIYNFYVKYNYVIIIRKTREDINNK